ncbi:S1 family peptidase [Streptomyces albipurpureus]|uniref:S1 family peptidase n=1 Tax=Streptomyces albipurpureus TaxID=2897419 RepID=A0ABT0UFK8_9ACTN|nr:S1 family peptidase [Streptomyces sp. CWNU-1]MCM2386825.1 S1 family peptidase [Streptomyces sp. CWNU-1]
MRRTLTARIFLSLLLTVPVMGLGASAASAKPEPSPGVTASATQYALDARLESALGEHSAGSYLDTQTGELVVAVTDETSAEQVRKAGARAQVVKRSTAQLEAAMAVLEERAKIPGTSWGIDPSTNQVAVEADESVSTQSITVLNTVASGLGDAVRIKRVPGVFAKELAGGDAIWSGGYRCSAAFNVVRNGVRSFLTAGHCTNIGPSWSTSNGGIEVGTRDGSSYPTNDYGIIRYTDNSQPEGTVNLYDGNFQDITSAADAIVGQAIQKSGSTTQLTNGSVTAVNVTVNYSDGPVYGLVRTTACSAGGDSGGAHFSGSTALGIHSGSSGCRGTNGSALHQPVTEALNVYQVAVY